MPEILPQGSRAKLYSPRETPPLDLDFEEGLGVFSAGITLQNPYSVGVRNLVNGGNSQITFEDDPEYDFTEDDANLGYDPRQMVFADSAEEASYIRGQLDNEFAVLERVNSHWLGTAGQIFGGVMRPDVLLGGYLTMGRGAMAVAATETLLEAGNEVALHQQQRLRTQQESFINIGLVGAATIIIGKGMEHYLKPKTPMAQVADVPEIDVLGDIPNVAPKQPSGGSVGASAVIDPVQILEDAPLVGVAADYISIGPASRLTQTNSSTAAQTSHEIADQVMYTKGTDEGRTLGPSMETVILSKRGEVVEVLMATEAAAKEAGMTKRQFKEALSLAARSNDVHENAVVMRVAKQHRAEYASRQGELQELGILPYTKDQIAAELIELKRMQTVAIKQAKISKATKEEIAYLKESNLEALAKVEARIEAAPTNLSKFNESYFPRIYDRGKVFRHWGRIKGMLSGAIKRDNPGMSRTDIDTAATSMAHNMAGGSTIRTARLGTPASLKARSVNILDNELVDFLDNDASRVLDRYTRSIDPFIEARKRFGPDGLQGRLDKVEAEYDALIDAAKTPEEKHILRGKKKSDIDDMEVMMRRVLGKLPPGVDPNSFVQQAIATLKSINVVLQLGGIVATSLPDIARPLMQYGFRGFAPSMMKTLGGIFTPATAPSKVQIRRMGAAIESWQNKRLAGITDQVDVSNRVVDFLDRAWGKITGFNLWTDTMEQIAGNQAMDLVLRMGEKLHKGKKLSDVETRKMARMGFNINDLTGFYVQALKVGGMKPFLKTGNSIEWQDLLLSKKFEAGIGASIRTSIVRVGVGDKPIMMDNPLTSLIFQYKTFAMASHNRMVVAGLGQRDITAATGMLQLIAMGYVVGASKAWLRGDDPSKWTPEKAMVEAIDRSGLLGVYSVPFSLMAGMATGTTSSRNLHRGMRDIIGGPSFGTLDRAVTFGEDVAEGDAWNENTKRLIPLFSNALHARQILERLGE